MKKTTIYVMIYGFMVAATLLQAFIVTTGLSTYFKGLSIIVLAIAEAFFSAGYFLNLRYESKALAILPIGGLFILSTFAVAAIFMMSM